MTLFDINGNEIEINSGSNEGTTITGKVGLDNLSEELINRFMVVDENTPIYNILDISKVSEGKIANGAYNKYYPAYRTSDYIEVVAGQTYVAQSWDSSGNTLSDRVELFDSNKEFVETYKTSGNGTIRYCIFTPSVNGFIRYCYTYSEIANPMVYIGVATTDTFVEYTGETLKDGNYDYEIANIFKAMVRRDVVPSNIFGKNVYMIGDSNSDNWVNGSAKELESRYGCTVKGYGQYGATWGTSDGLDNRGKDNAIGQYNNMIADLGIDEKEYTLPNNSVFLFMMGTNTHQKKDTDGNVINGEDGKPYIGELGDPIKNTSEDVDTDIGAMNYVLKRIKYYARNNAVGVFIPWAINAIKKDALIKLCEFYKIPYFDINAIICDDEPTKGLVRPDGTTVSQNYITDGGNHLAKWGLDEVERIAHHWIAYEI